MKITIRQLSGQNFQIVVEAADTVLAIKEKIQQVKQFEVSQQKLLRKGTLLDDKTTVGDAGIQEGEFLVVMVNIKKAPPAANIPPPQQPQQQQAQQLPPVEQPKPQIVPAMQPQANIGGGQGLLSGPEYEAAIENLQNMGFSKEECVAAMKAAFNNPDRAVEYLLNGIPPQMAAMQPQVGNPPVAGSPVAGNPLAGNPLAGLTGGQGGNAIAQLGQLIRNNPQALPQIIQHIQQTNPQLAAVIQQNPEQFLQLIMNQPQQQPQAQIQLSPQDQESLQTIMGMGFHRTDALEAFLACDKNVEASLNYLFERQANGELLSQHIHNEQNNPDNHGGEDHDPEDEDGDDDIYQ